MTPIAYHLFLLDSAVVHFCGCAARCSEWAALLVLLLRSENSSSQGVTTKYGNTMRSG